MFERIWTELGPWNWMVLGFILLGLEIAAPGFFLIWIGLAAVAVGVVSVAFWDAGFWPWQAQMLVFVGLSLIFVLIGRKMMNAKGAESDQPLLNRRQDQLVGRTATLAEAIDNGYGRAKIGDTLWRVRGTDAPAGARVKVVAIEADDLVVEAV